MNAATFKSWTNIAVATLNPVKAKVMLKKVAKRFSDPKGTLSDEAYTAWLKANAQPASEYVQEKLGHVADETQKFCDDILASGREILLKIPHHLGGGSGVPLLYAIVRDVKPAVAVETGVAAGWSSATILAAMAKNEKGHLYSSDFPYFRIENAEQYIGVVVDPALKNRWSLYLKGDENNIPKILSDVKGDIDFFHYDSDKSYIGRTNVLNAVFPRLAPRGVMLVDDIQDNCHFHDWVKSRSGIEWKVFSYRGKYIGMVKKTG